MKSNALRPLLSGCTAAALTAFAGCFPARARFSDVSAALGINLTAANSYNGTGVSFFDFDLDGYDDVTLGRGPHPGRIPGSRDSIFGLSGHLSAVRVGICAYALLYGYGDRRNLCRAQ